MPDTYVGVIITPWFGATLAMYGDIKNPAGCIKLAVDVVAGGTKSFLSNSCTGVVVDEILFWFKIIYCAVYY